MGLLTQIILNSDDASATGTPSNYTTTLANTITLNGFQRFEIALLSASFGTPEPRTNKPIFIECDLCDFSNLGGSRRRLLFKTNQNIETALQNEITHVIPLTPNFVRLEKVVFNTINIKIVDSDGAELPEDIPSSVTISIKDSPTNQRL